MNRKRLRQFEKLRDLAGKQLDQIRLELAMRRQDLERVHRDRESMKVELDQTTVGDSLSDCLTCYQLSNQRMMRLQHEMNQQAERIRQIEEEINQILLRYKTQQSKLKSWEKLVERTTNQWKAQEQKIEFDQADERFLSSSAAGVKK